MDYALDRPHPAALLTQWTIQPVALALVIVLAVAYLRGVRTIGARRPAQAWPIGRIITFSLGLLVLLWLTCGFAEVYAHSLYWVWTAQALVLWLGVPLLVLFGHPVQLARAVSGPGGRVDRLLRSAPVRIVANPLVGPALVPLLSGVLFFGPLPGWAIKSAAVGWLLQLALFLIGAVMVLPLVGLDEESSSLAVGLGLAIGSFELVLDALPGVVLRLNTHVSTSYFTYRAAHGWAPSALHDQQIAGGILWCVAEVIDFPFLVLVYRRWLRADARDAARVDAVLEAERTARRGLDPDESTTGDHPAVDRDAPWWISDPTMQERMRRRA